MNKLFIIYKSLLVISKFINKRLDKDLKNTYRINK